MLRCCGVASITSPPSRVHIARRVVAVCVLAATCLPCLLSQPVTQALLFALLAALVCCLSLAGLSYLVSCVQAECLNLPPCLCRLMAKVCPRRVDSRMCCQTRFPALTACAYLKPRRPSLCLGPTMDPQLRSQWNTESLTERPYRTSYNQWCQQCKQPHRRKDWQCRTLSMLPYRYTSAPAVYTTWLDLEQASLSPRSRGSVNQDRIQQAPNSRLSCCTSAMCRPLPG